MAMVNQSLFPSQTVSRDTTNLLAQKLIMNMLEPTLREKSCQDLADLLKVKDHDIASLVWNSFGTVTVFIQEIVSIYPTLSPPHYYGCSSPRPSLTLESYSSPGPSLTLEMSNRICNVLRILECIASHSDTKEMFLESEIPMYLYPFVETTTYTKPFENLRALSLSVIAGLVKVDATHIIHFLLEREIFPLCLATIDKGTSTTSKLIATYIIRRIISHEEGLLYVCTSNRFLTLCSLLERMVMSFDAERFPKILLVQIIHCYLGLTSNPRACYNLLYSLPQQLRDTTSNNFFCGDPAIYEHLRRLNYRVAQRNQALQEHLYC